MGGPRVANAKVKSGTSASRERGPWLRHPILFFQPVSRDGWLRLHPKLLAKKFTAEKNMRFYHLGGVGMISTV